MTVTPSRVPQAVMTVPPGQWELTLITHSEAGGSASSGLLISRANSNDARLQAITIGDTATCADCDTHFPDSPSRRFTIVMNEGEYLVVLQATAVPNTGASVTVNELTPPVQIRVSMRETLVYVVVRAQDGVTLNNYTVAIECNHCPYTPSTVVPARPPASSLGSSVWLMLVLLVAAVTLCCLSLLVCIRMQCLRVQQRREMLRRSPPMPQLSADEVCSSIRSLITGP